MGGDMKLKLRDGWEIGKTDKCYKPECDWVYLAGENWESAYAQFMDEKVYVYPNGEREDFEFDSIEDAHAYLISVGSESPWEVVE